jgi:hypothetical protein
VADSILSVFDAAIEPERPATPAAMPVEAVLSHYGPWEARVLHRAMALVWEHSTTTFLQSLAGRQDVWPADQVGPFGGTPLARGVAECTEQLAFFRFQVYRRRRGEATEIVRTRPPSVLVPPSLDPSRPADLATLAVAVAGCLPEHVLATTLGPAERDAVLDGLLTAFGPPGRLSGRIAQRAADVAQDLWHFVPPRTQNLLRAELSGTDLLDPGTWISEVLARRLLLGIRVSRDLRAGLRLGLAIGAGVPADATVTEALFRQALGRSTTLQRVLRTVLSEPFWQTFGG